LNLLSIRSNLSSCVTFLSNWNYELYFLVNLMSSLLCGWVEYNNFVMLQVCVDVFVTTQTYVDIASISTIPRTTGGQVYLNAKVCCLSKHMWCIHRNLNVKLLIFSRFIIITHSQLFLILQSFTTILDGISLGHKVLRL
jgi:hypothetical protein